MDKPFDLRLKSLELAKNLYGALPPSELITAAREIERYLATPAASAGTPVQDDYQWSASDLMNLKRCMDSFEVFLEHITVLDPQLGKVPFIPYGYQRRLAHSFQHERHLIVALPRQMGGTTLSAAYLLWKTLTRPGITVAFMAPKMSQAMEVGNRIRLMLEDLPQWLRVKTVTLNKSWIEFDNGSRIRFVTATPDALRGHSLNTLVIDQPAYISDRIGEEIKANLLPVLSSGLHTQLILVGLPTRDRGLMYDLHKDPKFVTATATWNEHPNWDQTWADNIKSMIGEESFSQEYDPAFRPVPSAQYPTPPSQP